MADEPKLPKKAKMGLEVKDRISGFTGIVVSDAGYLNACNRMLVQPKAQEDGTKLPESMAFDLPDLEVIGWGVLPLPKTEEEGPGGPHKFPGRSK